MESPREHVEKIRKTKFSIGGELNPLTEDLHQAVKNLSAELYAKDVHFLMELIQNAEDNEYLEGVDPSLEFIITSRDITATGAPATLLMFNNEKGFSSKNIESICSIGRSTKKGNRKHGYIGEKGIGFKSVFLITAQPYIFSNGYQIRFNEGPCAHCNLGYIVPEWVEENPSLSDLQQIYGSGSTLPTTTVVLPLKPDKVNPVKQQLSSIHPEILLFLSKIKHFSVREDNEDPSLNTVSDIAITSETNLVTRKNIDAESYTLYLSAKENGDAFETECSYYMWRQKFPVKQENKVERRMEVDELVITLAFPNEERLHRGMSSPGIYAFLPTEMVTNFPFIIQADFILASSRETILLDEKWNQGILESVSSAFVNAFISLVKLTEDAPVSNLPRMFGFLPIISSPYPKLNAVRESIRANLIKESIVPSESYMEQKFFHKPSEVGRIMPAFWDILKKAREYGVSLHNLSSHGCYILNSSFDKEEYDHILNFLGVKPVNNEWYAMCIQSSNIVLGVPEDVYLELLLFIADNWSSNFCSTDINYIPLLKYEGLDGNVSLFSINESTQQYGGKMLCLSSQLSWLIEWNREFRCVANHFFMPKSTLEAIRLCSKKKTLLDWLCKQVNVGAVGVYDYAVSINKKINSDRKLAIAYAHFLYHSFSKNHLSATQVDDLCSVMPFVDNYGSVSTRRQGILVPANGSNWLELMSSNPWRREGYIELSEEYLRPGYFAEVSTTGEQLIEFLKSHPGIADIPYISPPNAGIPAVSAPLTKKNAFLLLDWIRNLNSCRTAIPAKFLTCIKEGSWLKITMNGSPGCRPPSQSFMLLSSWGNILQHESVLVDVPLIDQGFYGDRIHEYREELKTIGVMFEFGEACAFIGKRLMSLAASSTLTRGNVLSMLNFIKFLREKFLSPDQFICSIKQGKWLRTSRGDRSPVGSVLFDQGWRVASKISDIPFIDQGYYGEEILQFKTELQLLGVVVGFNKNYQMVVDYLKSSSYLACLPADATLLILLCMSHTNSSDRLVDTLKNTKCLKTNLGYKSPGECFWFDPEWGCLLQVFTGFPLIYHEFYGSSIFNFKNQLKKMGVMVDFEEAGKAFACYFRQQASLSSIRKDNVMSFLSCYRRLKGTSHKFPQDLKNCIREVKWLRSRLGDYRPPRDCILYGPEWESISPITILPFIDDSNNYYGKGIHEYGKELKELKVVVEFKDGVKFVAAGLYIPHDPSCITPANVFSLLECIRILLQERISFPEAFLKKVSQKWLKTHAGYRAPNECLLFDSKWGSFLKRTDGPFVDEEFYGSNITSYRTELNAIGVTLDVEMGCSMLASHIYFHSEFDSIVRIYNFLRESNWEPDSEAGRIIWIPNGSKNGEWVKPEDCVLHDKDGLFGLQLTVLDKHYDRKLLSFFSSAFGVKSNPSVDDYCKLWKRWESSGHQLSCAECCAFWGCVMRQWSPKTEKTLAESLVKLPVDSGADGILLLNKSDVFIADDLQLKDLFQHFSPHPIFVWYPQPSLPSMPRTKLLEIYSKIGVRRISESVQKEELSLADGVELEQVNPRDVLISKGLVRLVLGFLADPSFKMEVEKRHEAVQCLFNLTVLETVEPITVSYTLSLSSGKIVNVKASRMIRWDRESSKLFAQKMDKSGGHKILIEYATYFSEVIAEGVLWDKEDHVSAFSELIKLAFLLEFNEEAIGFLMKSKNLQIFMEDEAFLSASFPSD